MTVTVTIETGSPRHKELEQRLREKFPSIVGIENNRISTRQIEWIFELNELNPQEVRSFFAQEGLIPTIE
jgi:hypothetical protein